MSEIAKRFALFVIGPLVLIALWFAWGLHRSLPAMSGEATVSGLRAPVDITRDQKSIVHIRAESDRDALFALGYVHAQDRLWQMEVQRRMGAGRLSEIFGKESLSIDKMMRTLGLRRLAERQLDSLSPAAREALEAYADGVNGWSQGRSRPLPVEFSLVGVSPAPWTPVDSLTWLKVLAWNLSGNYTGELDRLLLAQELGDARAAALYPEQATPVASPSLASSPLLETLTELRAFAERFAARTRTHGHHVGSNAWAIAGTHTASGLPLLANDPHVQVQIPSLFYLVSLRGNRLHAAGASFPGLPVLMFGRNASVAWGGTSFAADVQDLYIEQIDPTNPDRYAHGDDTLEMEVVEEIIEVRAAQPAALRPAIPAQRWSARRTVHGPVISDVLPIPSRQVVSLRWTGFEADDRSFDALFGLMYAEDWTAFRRTLALATAPPLAFAYADVDGNIGVAVAGKIPIRGGTGDGALPQAGWRAENAWIDYVPFDEHPFQFNPPDGLVVLANHRFIEPAYPYPITSRWPTDHRAQRIRELLEAAIRAHPQGLTVAHMQSIQQDDRSLAAQALLPYLLAHVPRNDTEQAALDALADWDGSFALDSVGATVFETWYLSLRETLLLDDLRGTLLSSARADFLQRVVDEIPIDFFVQALERSDTSWCDNVLSPARESCEDAVATALAKTTKRLRKLLGGRVSRWTWERAHHAYFTHAPFSEVNLLDLVFEKSIATGGDNYTVNLGESYFSVDDGFRQYVGPVYRHTVDLGDPQADRFALTPGQSGNPASAHYADLMRPHRDGQYYAMAPSADDIAHRTFVLRPGR